MKACKRGHIEEKDQHGKCRSCAREFNREYRKTEKYRAYRAEYIKRKAFIDARNKTERKQYMKAYSVTPSARIAQVHYRLKRKYGITLKVWQKMLDDQNQACLICRVKFDLQARRIDPCVDHCHSTGLVRGLICRLCNLGLGNFRDSPEALRRAADYIESQREGSL